MLAFNELGNSGRLGNQMFQYASLSVLLQTKDMTGVFHLSVSNALTTIVLRIVSSWKM